MASKSQPANPEVTGMQPASRKGDEVLVLHRELTTLRERVKVLEGALKPFAAIELSDAYFGTDRSESYWAILGHPGKRHFVGSNVIAARTALAEKDKNDE